MTKHDASAIIAELNAKAARKELKAAFSYDPDVAKASGADVLVISLPCGLADTGCMVVVPVAGRGAFTRASKLSVNGVPGHVGPAPNERLGIVDVLFAAESQSSNAPGYAGRHLFSDLLHGRECAVWCRSFENTEHRGSVRLAAMQFARFMIYDAPLDADLAALLGGCLFAGNKALVNGADALIAGPGVRASGRSIALTADLFPMKPETFLCDGNGVLAAHNVAFAVPLRLTPDPDALLARAAASAARASGADKERLAASERVYAAMLDGGGFRFADPGPGIF